MPRSEEEINAFNSIVLDDDVGSPAPTSSFFSQAGDFVDSAVNSARTSPVPFARVGTMAYDVAKGAYKDPIGFGRNLAADTVQQIGGVVGAGLGATTSPVTGPFGAGVGYVGGALLGEELANTEFNPIGDFKIGPLRPKPLSMGEKALSIGVGGILGGQIGRQAAKSALGKTMADEGVSAARKLRGPLMGYEDAALDLPLTNNATFKEVKSIAQSAKQPNRTYNESFLNNTMDTLGLAPNNAVDSKGRVLNADGKLFKPREDPSAEAVRLRVVDDLSESGLFQGVKSADDLAYKINAAKNETGKLIEDTYAAIPEKANVRDLADVIEGDWQNLGLVTEKDPSSIILLTDAKGKGIPSGQKLTSVPVGQQEVDAAIGRGREVLDNLKNWDKAQDGTVSALDLFKVRKYVRDQQRATGQMLNRSVGQDAAGNRVTGTEAKYVDTMYDSMVGSIDKKLAELAPDADIPFLNNKYGALDVFDELGATAQVNDSANFAARNNTSLVGTGGEKVNSNILDKVTIQSGIARNLVNIAKAPFIAMRGSGDEAMRQSSRGAARVAATDYAPNLLESIQGFDKLRGMGNQGKLGTLENLKMPETASWKNSFKQMLGSGVGQEAVVEGQRQNEAAPPPKSFSELASSIDYAISNSGLSDTRLDGPIPRDITNVNPVQLTAAIIAKTGGNAVVIEMMDEFKSAWSKRDPVKMEALMEGVSRAYPQIFQEGYGINGRIRNAEDQNAYMKRLEIMVQNGRADPSLLFEQPSAWQDGGRVLPMREPKDRSKKSRVKRVETPEGVEYR